MKVELRNIGPNQNEVILNGVTLFFSYSTLVAAHVSASGPINFYKTAAHYSKTTSRHINGWLNKAAARVLTQAELEAFVARSIEAGK